MRASMVGCAILFFSLGVFSGWFMTKWNALKQRIFDCENCRFLQGEFHTAKTQEAIDQEAQKTGPLPVRTWELRIPKEDRDILSKVADNYGLQGDARQLLSAIYLAENGVPGREMGVMNESAQKYKGDHAKSLELQAQWSAGTIKKHYDGYASLPFFANRWAPVGASNDPCGLNKNWLSNVQKILAEMNG